CLFQCSIHPPHLHPFPTRRSSDLRRGNLRSATGCDATFSANTLCLDNILVAHPYLEGTDGIALDRAGNIWNATNERNAVVVVMRDRKSTRLNSSHEWISYAVFCLK